MAKVKIPGQKVILCGEFGSGKSSIFRRFATNSFVAANDRRSTLGLDNFEKTYRIGDSGREIKVSRLGYHSFRTRNHKYSLFQLQLWDTGGMERVASVTSSYYKFAEAAILVFALDNASSFNAMSQHMLDIVTYAENAKIFLCGNKMDAEVDPDDPQVTDADMEDFCEQCSTLISATFKTSCKTGEGLEEMFQEIANSLETNRSRIELQTLEQSGFKVHAPEEGEENTCAC